MFSKVRRGHRVGAIVLAVGLLATACGTASVDTNAAPESTAAESAAPSEGGPGLPQLVADTVAGSQLDTNSLVGQDVVVWFWAPW